VVAFKLSFIKEAQLLSYQVQDVVYNLSKDKLEFRLANYFADRPAIKVTVKYFAIGAASNYGIAMSNIDDIEYRMTADAEKYIESLVKDISSVIKDNLGKEIENAKSKKSSERSKELLDNLPV
jgi:hypothetical protein